MLTWWPRPPNVRFVGRHSQYLRLPRYLHHARGMRWGSGAGTCVYRIVEPVIVRSVQRCELSRLTTRCCDCCGAGHFTFAHTSPVHSRSSDSGTTAAGSRAAVRAAAGVRAAPHASSSSSQQQRRTAAATATRQARQVRGWPCGAGSQGLRCCVRPRDATARHAPSVHDHIAVGAVRRTGTRSASARDARGYDDGVASSHTAPPAPNGGSTRSAAPSGAW